MLEKVVPRRTNKDPLEDLYEIFHIYNKEFFGNRLKKIELKWNALMTSTAGVTHYHGPGKGVTIHMSKPLLELRTRKDLCEILMHEMIHAYLYTVDKNKEQEHHGPKFLKHMDRINELTGFKIDVYHTFDREVETLKTHVWRCTGQCKTVIRRATNRAPGTSELWFREHQFTCKGEFLKVKGPPSKTDTIKRGKENKELNKSKSIGCSRYDACSKSKTTKSCNETDSCPRKRVRRDTCSESDRCQGKPKNKKDQKSNTSKKQGNGKKVTFTTKTSRASTSTRATKSKKEKTCSDSICNRKSAVNPDKKRRIESEQVIETLDPELQQYFLTNDFEESDTTSDDETSDSETELEEDNDDVFDFEGDFDPLLPDHFCPACGIGVKDDDASLNDHFEVCPVLNG